MVQEPKVHKITPKNLPSREQLNDLEEEYKLKSFRESIQTKDHQSFMQSVFGNKIELRHDISSKNLDRFYVNNFPVQVSQQTLEDFFKVQNYEVINIIPLKSVLGSQFVTYQVQFPNALITTNCYESLNRFPCCGKKTIFSLEPLSKLEHFLMLTDEEIKEESD